MNFRSGNYCATRPGRSAFSRHLTSREFGVRHLFIEFCETLNHTPTAMRKATLVIAMVSSNLADLVGTNRPRSSQNFCDKPNNEADLHEQGRVESQLLSTSDSMTDATDCNQVTNNTPSECDVYSSRTNRSFSLIQVSMYRVWPARFFIQRPTWHF